MRAIPLALFLALAACHAAPSKAARRGPASPTAPALPSRPPAVPREAAPQSPGEPVPSTPPAESTVCDPNDPNSPCHVPEAPQSPFVFGEDPPRDPVTPRGPTHGTASRDSCEPPPACRASGDARVPDWCRWAAVGFLALALLASMVVVIRRLNRRSA